MCPISDRYADTLLPPAPPPVIAEVREGNIEKNELYKTMASEYATNDRHVPPYDCPLTPIIGPHDDRTIEAMLYAIIYSSHQWSNTPRINARWRNPERAPRRHIHDFAFLTEDTLQDDIDGDGMPMHYMYRAASDNFLAKALNRPWQNGSNRERYRNEQLWGTWTLTLWDISLGFKRAKRNFPALFNKFSTQSCGQAPTYRTVHCDMMLQFALFGKILYL